MSDELEKQGSSGDDNAGMSKEEWLRQNPGQAVDPVGEERDEGMSKEEYLRKVQSQAQETGG